MIDESNELPPPDVTGVEATESSVATPGPEATGIPLDRRERFQEVGGLLLRFGQAHLDAELTEFTMELWRRLCRRRASDCLRGQSSIWAASVVHAIAQMNFLFDRSQPVHLTFDTICDWFHVNKNTVGGKATWIKRTLRLSAHAEPGLCRLSQLDMFATVRLPDGMIVNLGMAKSMGVVPADAYPEGAAPRLSGGQAGTSEAARQAVLDYRQVRATSSSMHGKVIGLSESLGFDAARMARRMTLPVAGRTLLFDGELAQAAFMDFWFHEYRLDGRCLPELADPAVARLTAFEIELLMAHRRTYTSLFRPGAVDLPRHQVELRDLLDPERPVVRLSDIGLSRSLAVLAQRPDFFCRLVTARGITMTTGFSFLFPPERAEGLRMAYRQKTRRVRPADLPEARFVFFYQKHRQFGLDLNIEAIE
ncbi:MAG: hypothetical protein H7A45_20015 [Verrucomicrobiales bacterium]|nr:hypothetical protein [Verrucomicrobiales bacterium]MCP5527490.1 hypothetical protein [Verrucomicrobiales bacterium]